MIMSSNCAPFYSEVDTFLLVNRQGDEPSHLAQVTRQPQDGKGYDHLPNCLSWFMGER